MKLKQKLFGIAGTLVVLFLIFGLASSCTKVEPGYVGIKVNQYGNQRGVQDFPIQTGRVWFNPLTQDVYKFPTFLQNVVWTASRTEGSPTDESITFNSEQGANLTADISISYKIEGDKVPEIFVEFRKPIAQITDVYIRNDVRNAFNDYASKMRAVDILGPGKQVLLDSVKASLNRSLGPKGFVFENVGFVGHIRPDPGVQNSINAVITANQQAIQAEAKVKQAEAEAQQMIAKARGDSASAVISAKGQAEANRLLRQSLTAALIQYQATLKWNGVLPSVTGSAIPMLNLNNGKN